MKRMKIWVLACALLAKNISEAHTVRKMTLKDCMEYAISNSTSFNNGYSLSGGIMLFNGFQAINNLKISKTMMEMGLSKDQQVKDGICLTTMEAFYNAVYYAEMVKTMQIQVEAAEKSLALAQKEESLGQKGHADVVQMEADLAPSICWKAHRKRPCSSWCFGDEFFCTKIPIVFSTTFAS